MFQLKHRLERAKVSQTHDSLSSGDNHELCSTVQASNEDDDDEIPDLVEVNEDKDDFKKGSGVQGDDNDTLIDENGICDGKLDTGNKSV
jgi:hypothetical protein